jgi:hypothetical protein
MICFVMAKLSACRDMICYGLTARLSNQREV